MSGVVAFLSIFLTTPPPPQEKKNNYTPTNCNNKLFLYMYVSQIISNTKNEVKAGLYFMILILQVALNRKKVFQQYGSSPIPKLSTNPKLRPFFSQQKKPAIFLTSTC